MEKASSTSFEFRHQALDVAYLQRLYQHEPSYAFDMFDGFLREIGARIAQLGNAIAENNREQVKYYAHQLRAFTGIVGLTRVQLASERLESCSMAGSPDTIQQLFGEISTGVRLSMQPVRLEFERLRAFLQSRDL
nr:Hpt domain-containing protein [uncultured Chitinophaga sp.]